MTVSIGSQTDVPAAGDPIISPWYQDTATKLIHPFASLAALNAGWSSPPNGAHAFTLDTATEYVRVAGSWVSLVAPAWTAPTYVAPWADFGGGYQTVGYRKVGDTVQVKGLAAGGSAPSHIFTVPAGYRPTSGQIVLNTLAQYSGASPVVARVDVQTDGAVGLVAAPSMTAGGWISFAGISWVAA